MGFKPINLHLTSLLLKYLKNKFNKFLKRKYNMMIKMGPKKKTNKDRNKNKQK